MISQKLSALQKPKQAGIYLLEFEHVERPVAQMVNRDELKASSKCGAASVRAAEAEISRACFLLSSGDARK